MNILTIQQIAESDPHGLIITVVSVSVVFAALILLYFAYTLTGKLVNWNSGKPVKQEKKKRKTEDGIHDKESYVITIRKEYSPSAHSYLHHDTQATKASRAYGGNSGENVSAPLPGIIVKILVKPGDVVKPEQTVAILEAMKMENEIQAEHGGTVQSVNVSKGDSVLEGTSIVTLR